MAYYLLAVTYAKIAYIQQTEFSRNQKVSRLRYKLEHDNTDQGTKVRQWRPV